MFSPQPDFVHINLGCVSLFSAVPDQGVCTGPGSAEPVIPLNPWEKEIERVWPGIMPAPAMEPGIIHTPTVLIVLQDATMFDRELLN